jgi:hypothetical protein
MEHSWMHLTIVADLAACWFLAALALVETTTRREPAPKRSQTVAEIYEQYDASEYQGRKRHGS